MDGLPPEVDAIFDATVLGYPLESLARIPKGTYTIQALLHRYETFYRADGYIVKPMDRGEGQHWNLAPGNLYSTPRRIDADPARAETISISLDQVIPPIPEPTSTKWVKHERIRSERLSKLWGRDMYLGAHVLLPLGFDEHPEARYPFVIFHGHFPESSAASARSRRTRTSSRSTTTGFTSRDQMSLPKIAERIRKSAPQGADLKSWDY